LALGKRTSATRVFVWREPVAGRFEGPLMNRVHRVAVPVEVVTQDKGEKRKTREQRDAGLPVERDKENRERHLQRVAPQRRRFSKREKTHLERVTKTTPADKSGPTWQRVGRAGNKRVESATGALTHRW
jgi:hypothetical protein